jgi:enterochelin esterase-like enzyme
VGVWNSGAGRHADYFPQEPFVDLSDENKMKISQAKRPEGSAVFQRIAIRSDAYLEYLVQVVKVFVDEHYPTLKDRDHCFISGSSMGGLISLYAVCKYPEIFGGTACLSTHWPGIFQTDDNPFPESMFLYLKNRLPDVATHRIYFDLGTKTLDSLYARYQQQVDGIMKSKGFTSYHWITKVFEGDDHSERSWAGRLGIPLAFLLGQ